jgi:WD40 repeat protein
VLGGPEHICHRLAFSPDGQTLVSGSTTGMIQVWKAADGELVHSWRGHPQGINAVAFSPVGLQFATAGMEGKVLLWDAGTGSRVLALEHPRRFATVAFSPDGKLLATGGEDQAIHLWDVTTGRLVRSLHGHTSHIFKLTFSPERPGISGRNPGQRLVSASRDGTVRLWDVESGQVLLSLPGVAGPVLSVAFSTDGRRIAAVDTDVLVWEAMPSRK